MEWLIGYLIIGMGHSIDGYNIIVLTSCRLHGDKSKKFRIFATVSSMIVVMLVWPLKYVIKLIRVFRR